MRKEEITKHEAILKAQELLGTLGDPVLTKTKPAQDLKPLPDLTAEERTAILTEAFTHFARSMNVSCAPFASGIPPKRGKFCCNSAA